MKVGAEEARDKQRRTFCPRRCHSPHLGWTRPGALIHSPNSTSCPVETAPHGLATVTAADIRTALLRREARVSLVDPSHVSAGLYGLLNLSPGTLSLKPLRALARILGVLPCDGAMVVDAQGNPYSEWILVFLDTILVLYHPLATAMIHSTSNAAQGVRDNADDEQTVMGGTVDRDAFGALAAAQLAPRLLVLVPYAHRHVLRALWLALLYLSIVFDGSERGVAVDFLLERVQEEWLLREARERAGWLAAGGGGQRDRLDSATWRGKVKRMTALRRRARLQRGDITSETVWGVMNGLRQD